jgi:hypothetical protein
LGQAKIDQRQANAIIDQPQANAQVWMQSSARTLAVAINHIGVPKRNAFRFVERTRWQTKGDFPSALLLGISRSNAKIDQR